MTNWITRLLALLFFSSLAGLAFLFFFLDIAGWIQIPGYAVPPVLSVFYMFFCGYAKKGWIVALMLAATTSFNIPLQNWLFHSADDIVQYKSAEALYQPENKALYFRFDDSLPRNQYRKREVIAWITDMHKKDLQPVVCFERCRFNLEDYQKAAKKSPCRLHRANAPFIRPL